MTRFFYDSYAIISFLDGEAKFKKYFSQDEGITSAYCIMEVHYSLLKKFPKEKAEEVIDALYSLVVNPSFEELKEAVEFRAENKKKELSYSDSLGYIIAKKRKLKFLTGDKAFKNMKKVEFVT
jgi:predicted nucleic acid-binding protein